MDDEKRSTQLLLIAIKALLLCQRLNDIHEQYEHLLNEEIYYVKTANPYIYDLILNKYGPQIHQMCDKSNDIKQESEELLKEIEEILKEKSDDTD